MSAIDRVDWTRLQEIREKERRPQEARALAANLNVLRQAAVSAERLMDDEHWRVYQQMLQSSVEQMRLYRARLVDTLLADGCDSLTAMTRTKRLIAECDASIRMAEAAIALPRQIQHNGAQAAELLEKEVSRYAGTGED